MILNTQELNTTQARVYPINNGVQGVIGNNVISHVLI